MNEIDALALATRLYKAGDVMRAKTRRPVEIHMRVDDYESMRDALLQGKTFVGSGGFGNAIWGLPVFRDDSVPVGEVHLKTTEEVQTWQFPAELSPKEYAIIWAREVVYIDERVDHR